MNQNNILLSITIPTVNRSKELEENLLELLPQLCGRDDVEICICDNACEDNTENIVRELLNRYNCKSTYKRYEKRVPGRENFKRAVNLTSGEYVLLMGDDDILAPYFVSVIIDFLNETNNKLDFIHFNRMYGPPKFNDCRLFDFRRFTNIKKYKVTDFIENYLAAPTFMSSIVFKRASWENGTKYEKGIYYGYEWLSQILFGSINGNCAYCYFPLVLARNSYRPWLGNWPLYGIVGLSNLFNDLSIYNENIKKEWKKVLHDNKTFLTTISYIALDKKLYKKRKDEIKACLINKKEKVWFYTILYIFPKWFTTKVLSLSIKVYYTLKAKIFHKEGYKHLF